MPLESTMDNLLTSASSLGDCLFVISCIESLDAFWFEAKSRPEVCSNVIITTL